MDDLIVEFITETTESLAEIDMDLVKLEQDPNDKNLLGNIFRLMHTIKGTCGFLGLPRLEKTAHAAENVLGRFRDGDLDVRPEYVTLIFESIDRVRFLLSEIEENGAEPEGDDKDLIEKLDAVYEGRDATQSGDAPTEQPSEPAKEEPSEGGGTLSQDELDALEAAFAAADGPDDLDIATPAATEDKDLTNVLAEAVVQEMDAKAEEKAQETAPLKEEKPAPLKAAPKAKEGGAKAPSVASQSLRVNVDVLENLMTMVSELVLTRNQLMQILRIQQESDFGAPLQRLNHVVSDLQEGVMKTRMQPIGNAWAKLPRIIRDLSIELNKKIDLQMVGQETELDRQVLDLIKDPLTHMVRNSGDHGIEGPEDRVAAGKPETGTILLKAYHEGGHILIEISDDGKGLNTEKIKEKIIKNEVATEEELATMTDKQIHQYIFAAGFSTAEKVTSVSGRGVGMDVVRTNIEKIGGTIDLDSKEGEGSKFTIKIPLTLAIVSALIVEAKGEKFAIPQLSVQELVMVSANDENSIEMIKGTPVFRLRDRLLPLIYLDELLQLKDKEEENIIEPIVEQPKAQEETEEVLEDIEVIKVTEEDKTEVTEAPKQIERHQNKSHHIIVTQVGSYSLGIIVDRVFDTEEIVVKPVSPILKKLDLFSGNTILGDGSVIMILDPAGIARATGDSNMSGDSEDLRDQEEEERRKRDMEKTALLVFYAGDKTPKAVPLSLVSRLEEIQTDKIEFSSNKMIIQYRGELMPLITYTGTTELADKSRQACLVFTSQGKSMGLIVDEIVDIKEDHLNVQVSGNNPGILGSSIIEEKATDIIDVAYFLEEAFGKEWYGATTAYVKDGENGKRRILLVDDSPFFRNMLTPLLGVAGYDVTTAESPMEALEMAETGAQFDVIISDIEMPEMSGFEFAEKVKGGSQWQDTPMVALSSHATAQDMDVGFEKGFSKYVAKFDRDSLLSTLSETLSEVQGQEKTA